MEHTSVSNWGILWGVLSVLLVALLIWAIFRKIWGRNRQEYDERQKLAQGKAYKAAFFTMLSYSAVYGLQDVLIGIRWCELYTGLFIGILLSVLVFGIICIREDAYISFQRKPTSAYAILLIISAFNLLPAILHLGESGYLIDGGILTAQAVNPLIGVVLLALVLAMAARDRQTSKSSGREG